MPRLRIIILETEDRKINYAMWADVPAARQRFYADAAKVSAWKDALAEDNASLQSGAMVEQTGHISMESGDNNAQKLSKLDNIWQSFQSRITALNKWDKYGSTRDATGWTQAGVA